MPGEPGAGRSPRADGGFDFGEVAAPGQVAFDDSLLVAQTVDPTGAGGVRLYRLDDDECAMTTYSRDPRSGTGWSESLLARGTLAVVPVELDPAVLRDRLDGAGGERFDEQRAAAVLDAYEDRCADVVQAGLFDAEAAHEVVLRGMTAYVEEFDWPEPLVSSLEGVLAPAQLEALGQAVLDARTHVDDDSWSRLRGHYVAELSFAAPDDESAT